MRATLKDEESVKILLADLDRRKINAEVIQSLVAFNSNDASEIKLHAISKLRQDTPLFVLTGQQVGLFGGPLLTLYKAVTAIKAAKVLSEKFKRNVLPVFWLQSEDHDLPEIATTTILSAAGELKNISVNTEKAKANRKSVSQVLVEKEILSAIDELSQNLSALPNSEELLKAIVKSYPATASWDNAFLTFFTELFRNTELLFFDINSSKLKSHPVVKQVFQKSISDLSKIEKLLTACTKGEQVLDGVVVKPNSPLCFIEDENENRFRLTLDTDGNFTASGQKSLTYSKDQLLRLVETEPQRFSTSALLRPILQDSLFPTVGYVGGDAELQYHRQLDNLYPHFGLKPPLLLPRSKFRLLSKKAKQVVDDLGLDLDSYKLSNEKIGQLLRENGRQFGIDSESFLQKIKIEIETISDSLKVIVKETDITLEEPLKKTSATAISAYSQFIGKLSKAAMQKDSVILGRIEKVRALLFPLDKEQERELGLISILARTGPGILQVLEELSGKFDGNVQTLVIEEL